MTGQKEHEIAFDRAVTALLGGVAGLALWVFADVLPDRIDDLRWLLFMAALVMGGFAVLLALSGPLRPGRAALAALAVAVPAALLLLWASFRHAGMERFLDSAHGSLAYGAILFIATPFVGAALQAPKGARDYARLFDLSWTIVVRYAAGALFLGLFWAVLLLSDQLLQLVGLDIIEELLRLDPLPYLLSGLVLGLALAVVHELRDYVSPYLIHRLLRLLLPMLLPVVAVFILALPLRGLEGLFGGFSAAATLMGVAMAGITLISTALDRSDEEAATAPVMQWSARAFSLAVPVLAGLAVYAVWLRVAQYGWTPQRLMAALAGAFLIGYGLLYTAMVLRGGPGWMQRIREANRVMAMILVAVSALWLTPLLSAERIAAQSQLARARADLEQPSKAALWEMAHLWGHVGQQALASLEAEARAAGDEPGAGDMLAAIERARTTNSRYAYERGKGAGALAPRRAELARLLQLRPEGIELPDTAFAELSEPQVDNWLRGCRTVLPDGRAGCVVVLGDFRPGLMLPNGYLLLNRVGHYADIFGIVLRDGKLEQGGYAVSAESMAQGRRVGADLSEADISAVLDGRHETVPVPLNALKIGDKELIPDN